jgi:hypothetical protein
MAERLDGVTTAIKRGRPADPYTQELQRHTLEQVEREVHWLEELIDAERNARRVAVPAPSPAAARGASRKSQAVAT